MKITYYRKKYNPLMSVLIPTMREWLDVWRGDGWSNRWLAREISEKILEEVRDKMTFLERLKLAFSILIY